MPRFTYDAEKNKKIKQERGISFDEIIALMESGNIVDVLEHPNPQAYPGQQIYLIDISGCIWLVPFLERVEEIVLKTAFPSRKHTKSYREV